MQSDDRLGEDALVDPDPTPYASPSERVRRAWERLTWEYLLVEPGGVFLAGAPSRYHDQELRHVLPEWGERSPFDAEDAERLVAACGFAEVEAEWWEAPAYRLPDRGAVIDYLVAFKVPEPERRADEVDTPTVVTKSGVNIWARR